MLSGIKHEIIHYNNQPDGIRSIRRPLSTITTYVIPRPLLSQAKKITGINRPGVYYLINENDENKIISIYIGQTRNGITRLDDHNQKKRFWNKAIMFLADNDTFSLDILSGLEKYAIVKAYASKRYSVENSVKPQYEIGEHDLYIIEEIYSEIQFVMATQGFKLSKTAKDLNYASILHTTRNKIQAFGLYDGERFEVLEGSQINIEKPAILERYNRQRSDLLNNGSISLVDDRYILHVTIEFNTPSGASDFVLGGSTNGWVEWKNEENKTLDDLYRK